MATVGSNYLTLADVRRQTDANDDIANIVEILALSTPLTEDAPVFEANSGNRHLTTIRTGLPRPTWRKLYEGVMPTKGTTAQVYETTGFMEDWSEVDAKLVDMSKNPRKLRANEARAHIMGIGQELEQTLWYGNTDVWPERFNGLDIRYNSLSAGNGGQIIDAGGTGSDNTSIWFIRWGEDSVHLIYPEGSSLGLRRDDKGMQTKELNDGSLYDVYREKFQMDAGLAVRDWRAIARIANLDVSNLRSGVGAPDLISLMLDAYYALDKPAMPNGNLAIYVPRTLGVTLHKQALDKINNNLTLDTIEGRPITRFMGAPIRVSDSILTTEARIV